MKNYKGMTAILGLLAAVFAGTATAQDRGLYIGASGGVSQYQNGCQEQIGICDDHDVGGRAFLGYQFTKLFGLEAGYADMGKMTVTDPALPVNTETTANGFDVLAVFTFPLTKRLTLLPKVGAHRFRLTVEDRTTGAKQGGTNSAFAYGIGFGYDMGKLGLRAEFLRYDSVGRANSAFEDNVMFYSLGALFRFY